MIIDIFFAYTLYPTVLFSVFLLYFASNSGCILFEFIEKIEICMRSTGITPFLKNCAGFEKWFIKLIQTAKNDQIAQDDQAKDKVLEDASSDFDEEIKLVEENQDYNEGANNANSSSDSHNSRATESDGPGTDNILTNATSHVHVADAESIMITYAEILKTQKYLTELLSRFARFIPQIESQQANRSQETVQSQVVRSQAVVSRATTSQAITSQAAPQGFASQGIASQGIASQGVASKGIASKEIASKAITPQTITPEALTPQAITSQIIASQGVDSRIIALQAIASHGLTSEDIDSRDIPSRVVTPEAIASRRRDSQRIALELIAARAANQARICPDENRFRQTEVLNSGLLQNIRSNRLRANNKKVDNAEVDNVTIPQLIYNHPSVCYYKINRQIQEDKIAKMDSDVYTDKMLLPLPNEYRELSILGFDKRIFRYPFPEEEFRSEMAIVNYFANKENIHAKLPRPWTTEGEPHFSHYIDITPNCLRSFHLLNLAILRMVQDVYLRGEMEKYLNLSHRKLGSGLNGSVVMAEFKDKSIYPNRVAVKSLSSHKAQNIFQAYFMMQEAYIITRNPHPNIIQGIKVFCNELGTAKIALELMSCSLADFLHIHKEENNSGFSLLIPEDIVVYLFYNIVKGLVHLIDVFGLYHGDIKPDNVLLHENSSVKLADFGLCRRAGRKHIGLNGTPLYMAPEVFAQSKKSDEKSDIWSLGILLLYLLDTDPKFDKQFMAINETDKAKFLSGGLFDYRCKRNIHDKFRRLLGKMFIATVNERIGIHELKDNLETLIEDKTIPYCNKAQFMDYYKKCMSL